MSQSAHRPRGALLRQPLRLISAVMLAAASLCTAAHAEGRQSPIDINPLTTVGAPLPTVTRNYQVANVSVVNTFNPAAVPFVPKEFATLRVNVPAGSSVSVNGAVYDLVQFHFHTPSEHTVLGIHAPMEVHFVHLRRGACLGDAESLLVIGANIWVGLTQNAELQKIFSKTLPTASTSTPLAITGFDLSKVLPLANANYRYAGSLTAPSAVGCNNPAGDVAAQLSSDVFPENVNWIVLETPLYVSLDQLFKFQQLFNFKGNSRATKPLAGRTVYRDQNR